MHRTWATELLRSWWRAAAPAISSPRTSTTCIRNSGVPDDRIIELHGNTRYAKCLDCGARAELEPIRKHFEKTGEPPGCQFCAGMLKTATISFGQAMPEAEMARAESATRICDLFLVLGSSLVVYPAAGFPLMAKRRGARLIIVNREETPQDELADLVLHAEIGPTIQGLLIVLTPVKSSGIDAI